MRWSRRCTSADYSLVHHSDRGVTGSRSVTIRGSPRRVLSRPNRQPRRLLRSLLAEIHHRPRKTEVDQLDAGDGVVLRTSSATPRVLGTTRNDSSSSRSEMSPVRRVRDELLSVAGRLARWRHSLKQSPEKPGSRFSIGKSFLACAFDGAGLSSGFTGCSRASTALAPRARGRSGLISARLLTKLAKLDLLASMIGCFTH